MNKQEFLTFVTQSFNISGAAVRLINNILDYAENNIAPENQRAFLQTMLDGTIGLTVEEINQLSL